MANRIRRAENRTQRVDQEVERSYRDILDAMTIAAIIALVTDRLTQHAIDNILGIYFAGYPIGTGVMLVIWLFSGVICARCMKAGIRLSFQWRRSLNRIKSGLISQYYRYWDSNLELGITLGICIGLLIGILIL